MIQSVHLLKSSLLLIIVSSLLSGCLGGSVAQQIAQSIATSVADNAVASAMDVQESGEQDRFAQKNTLANIPPTDQKVASQNLATQYKQSQNTSLQNAQLHKNTLAKETPIDPYTLAFMSAQFEELKPIAEPLPEQAVTEVEVPIAVAQSSQLVRVELFNLLIGEEKAAVYAKAQLIGAMTLPKKREWKFWQVGTGVITSELAGTNTNSPQKLITFLIPPEFGKLPSGSIALVELANPGELNIARYKLN